MRQVGSLEAYIQDFDILWNIVEIYEQTLVFFIGGMEIEIKNPVKIFE